MQLRIQITSGGEGQWRGRPDNGAVFYGGPPPDTGEWKVEIAELEGWGDYFLAKRGYMSHRPKLRALIAVGQLNWPDVKDLSEAEQFRR